MADIPTVTARFLENPEARIVVIGVCSAIGVYVGVTLLRAWKFSTPSELATVWLFGAVPGVLIPVFAAFAVHPTRDTVLPDPVVYAAVVLFIGSLAVMMLATTAVLYRVVADWYWKRRERIHGDVWHIEHKRDGSTRAVPSRVSQARERAANRVIGAGADVAGAYRREGFQVPEPPAVKAGQPVGPLELIRGDLAVFTDHYAVVVNSHTVFSDGAPITFADGSDLPDFLGFIRPAFDRHAAKK